MNWSEVISNLLHPTHSCETVHTLISVLSFLLNPDAWFSANLAHNSIWAWGSRTKVQMLFFHISCLSVFYSGSRSWGEAGQADPLLPQGSLVVLRCSFSSVLKRVSFSILSISDSLDTSLMLAWSCACCLPLDETDCPGQRHRMNVEDVIMHSRYVCVGFFSSRLPQVFQREQRSENSYDIKQQLR